MIRQTSRRERIASIALYTAPEDSRAGNGISKEAFSYGLKGHSRQEKCESGCGLNSMGKYSKINPENKAEEGEQWSLQEEDMRFGS